MKPTAWKRITVFLLLALCALALLTGCAPKKGVTVDGKKASIAESGCSMTLSTHDEMTYDEMKRFMGEKDADYYANRQEDFTFWMVEFRHQGEHEFSSVAWQPGGFAPTSEINYRLDDGNSAKVLAGNVGLSRAYLAVPTARTLQSAGYKHSGYTFTYSFADGQWSFVDPNSAD